MAELKYGLIGVDEHVQEHPEVWTQRLSRARWGDRIPHIERQSDGAEHWVVDGQKLPLTGVASVGAAMPDRAREPHSWAEVPTVAYKPAERLHAMDVDGVDYAVLYPIVAGVAGEAFARLTDAELELACVQAYNDWLSDEWASVSKRFVPQCIVPMWPIDATVKEVMTRTVRSVKEDTPINEVMNLMASAQIRRVPVVNNNDEIVGIVSIGDLAKETNSDNKVGQTLEDISEGKSNN